MDLYSASSLKQHFTSIYVAPLGHIILIQSQPIFALCPLCCMLNQRSNKYQFHCPWFNTTRESNPEGKLVVHYTTETVFISDHGYDPLFENTCGSFPHSWLIIRFVTRVTRWVPLVEKKWLTLPEHPSGVGVTRSLVLCVIFCRSMFVLLSFFFLFLITPLVSSNSSYIF